MYIVYRDFCFMFGTIYGKAYTDDGKVDAN